MDTTIDQKKLALFLKRYEAFEAFTAQRLNKRSLAEVLSVSRPTAYRIITAFEEEGILRRVDGKYELTRLGELIMDAITTFQNEVAAVVALEPLLAELPDELDFDHRLFADAVVTEATYDDPFRPMARFIELFEDATTIKGFNKSFLEPMYIEQAARQIEAGMETDVIYDPRVVELVVENYPQIAQQSFESENVRTFVHDDLPVALAVFEERIGIGIHTEEMGTPVTWVDTGNPEAIAWGEALFERYRAEATPLH